MSFPTYLKNNLHYEATHKAFADHGLGEIFKSATLGAATEWIVRQPVNLVEAGAHGLKSFIGNEGIPALAGTAAIGLGVYGANSAVDQMKANLINSHREGTYIPGGY